MDDQSLSGLKILIPRPHPLGVSLANLIEHHGGVPIVFPVIEITDPLSFKLLDQFFDNFDAVDLIIFSSIFAVKRFYSRLIKHNLVIPENLKIATVGPATADYCKQQGITVDFSPIRQANSERLFDVLDHYDIAGKRIVIMRGQSGRDWLQKKLMLMGCEVQAIPSYQRRTTRQSIWPIVETWRHSGIDAVVITSISILDSLVELLGLNHKQLLYSTPVVTISQRIEAQCIKEGVETVLVSTDTTESMVLKRLKSLLSE